MAQKSLTLAFTLEVPLRLLPVVAQLLREEALPNDDGVTDVAIMREQDCSVEDYVAAGACLYDFKRAVEDAARHQASLEKRGLA